MRSPFFHRFVPTLQAIFVASALLAPATLRALQVEDRATGVSLNLPDHFEKEVSPAGDKRFAYGDESGALLSVENRGPTKDLPAFLKESSELRQKELAKTRAKESPLSPPRFIALKNAKSVFYEPVKVLRQDGSVDHLSIYTLTAPSGNVVVITCLCSDQHSKLLKNMEAVVQALKWINAP